MPPGSRALQQQLAFHPRQALQVSIFARENGFLLPSVPITVGEIPSEGRHQISVFNTEIDTPLATREHLGRVDLLVSSLRWYPAFLAFARQSVFVGHAQFKLCLASMHRWQRAIQVGFSHTAHLRVVEPHDMPFKQPLVFSL